MIKLKKRNRTEYMREYMRERREDPDYRAKLASLARERYKDPEVRKKRLESRKRWELKYPEKRRAYVRANRLCLNGKQITIRKRLFAGVCELCGNEIKKRPKWHHWDDEHPEKGMWICDRCHWLADAVEYDPEFEKMNKYKKLKETL